jgi:hypothetical protein
LNALTANGSTIEDLNGVASTVTLPNEVDAGLVADCKGRVLAGH